MEGKKRAIILDMDETLERGIYRDIIHEDGAMMVLRPNLDELIVKLQEAKKQGIDIILCTTAQGKWVERFLTLKPEFRTLFDKMLTRDNEDKWKNIDGSAYPIERECYGRNPYQKPVTTFGYDSILFIDDNLAERNMLQRLFDTPDKKIDKDVTYFSGFGFYGGEIDLIDILRYKKAATLNPKVAQKLEKYLNLEISEQGCHMMCSAINAFMNKDFVCGLTIADKEYLAEYEEFRKQLNSLIYELEDLSDEIEEQTGEELYRRSDDELSEIKKYLETDKRCPYEGIGIEVAQLDNTKREQLRVLVQTAKNMQAELDQVQKGSYDQSQNGQEL